MREKRTIKVGKKNIETYLIKLSDKNLIILKGSQGYIMCGYLNLSVANKFREVAVKVTGVSSIEDILKTKVHSVSYEAKKLGLRKNQKIKDVIKIIA